MIDSRTLLGLEITAEYTQVVKLSQPQIRVVTVPVFLGLLMLIHVILVPMKLDCFSSSIAQ